MKIMHKGEDITDAVLKVCDAMKFERYFIRQIVNHNLVSGKELFSALLNSESGQRNENEMIVLLRQFSYDFFDVRSNDGLLTKWLDKFPGNKSRAAGVLFEVTGDAKYVFEQTKKLNDQQIYTIKAGKMTKNLMEYLKLRIRSIKNKTTLRHILQVQPKLAYGLRSDDIDKLALTPKELISLIVTSKKLAKFDKYDYQFLVDLEMATTVSLLSKKDRFTIPMQRNLKNLKDFLEKNATTP